ncbi:oligopeptide ABC transporter substrate-binding protein [Pseudogracilibacillus auburnensis]|uniref:Peptide/nickel transport system substrate-binding protein n=1 Tax=Pseudogracilibacillus auburnensis TaxID=1494959 RepID=A0A2V3W1N0_9BACI|nr:oligopeptide ABC transporter substrate-binding protein [Pseudogracilibacillus auburnensis]PXW87982.1 peptide/nickel transport system substrate-binding protein [Pseudogracilibacillus auburnensis]
MKKKLLLFLSILFALSLVLGACGGSNDDTSTDGEDSNSEDVEEETTDEKGEQEGGTLTFAIDQEPEGLFMDGFSKSAIDAQVNEFIHESLWTTNEELEYIPAIAEWETEDNKVFHFTFQEGVKWHNGEELTVEDWQFALEVLAHPDYEGDRYTYVQDIEGVDEYNSGEADSISGFEIVDDYNATITFKEKKINNLENLWSGAMPKKELEDIPVGEMDAAPEIRETPVGLGPFKIKEIQAGEYVSMERFDDYWKGTPKLDEILLKVIDPSLTLGALQNGEVDFMEIRPDDIDELEQFDHINIVEQKGLGYSYVGFRFGHWDKENKTSVADYDKFNDKRLRQAMFYALDRESIVNNYLNGKATIVNTPIPSVHWIAADESELTQYDYDPDKAEELLDEAGYKKGDDGFRTDPDGNEFVVKFAHYAGPAAFEGRSQAIMQNWEDVGIKTELATGQLIEFNTYNDMKDNDDEVLETFFGSWSVGTDPDPTGLWGSKEEYNFGRWVNEESDALLADGLSEASFDDDHRKNVYIEWQKLFNEELPAIPLWENLDLYGINERVQGYTIDATGLRDYHEWYVTD